MTVTLDLSNMFASSSFKFSCSDGSTTYYTNSFTIEITNAPNECIYDVITLNTEGVSSTEDMVDSYKSISSIPRLVVSQTTGETVSADLTGRFKHNDTTCSFSNYRISHVVDKDGANLTEAQVIERYSMSIAGVFKTLASTNITNDLVYIEASNGYVWGGATEYLVDYSYAAAYEAPEPTVTTVS